MKEWDELLEQVASGNKTAKQAKTELTGPASTVKEAYKEAIEDAEAMQVPMPFSRGGLIEFFKFLRRK